MARKNKNKPGTIEGAPFSYQATADGKVFVARDGRQVAILKGDKAAVFLKRIDGLSEEKQQLAMAKASGNFKRGNERN